MTFTVLIPLIAAGLSGIVALGTGIYHFVVARRDAANTPEMVENAQAKTDIEIEETAEEAIEASDKGKPRAEQAGDAQ